MNSTGTGDRCWYDILSKKRANKQER